MWTELSRCTDLPAQDHSEMHEHTLHQILETTFGFRDFRSQQRAIIEGILENQHALVIMPTGMGKSLCYQVPALFYRRQPNSRQDLTVVISPLIALMKDQVDALRRRQVDATYINSSLTRGEREQRYQGVRSGEFDLLYVTPERFRKPEFLASLSNRRIRLLAVDEAHCISEWGHDFRPDYTRLEEFRELLRNPTTVALTATATPEVQTDIVRQLGLQLDEIRIFHEGIDRPNLTLQVRDCWGDDEKQQAIIECAQKLHIDGGSGIVYFTLIKTLERFSELLDQRRIRHLVYHGDLDRRTRRNVHSAFMKNDSLVLATNAFGMGIDKEDIRFVLHAEVPGSMESYYQEIGRAGRDGYPAECWLLYDERDLTTQMEFIRWSNPDAELYERVYLLLKNEQESLRAFGLDWLRERLHARPRHDHRLETILAMLDRHNVTAGEIDPWDLKVVSELPEQLQDADRLQSKLLSDQQKLYTLVQYVQHEGDRKAFIHEYFGLPYQSG